MSYKRSDDPTDISWWISFSSITKTGQTWQLIIVICLRAQGITPPKFKPLIESHQRVGAKMSFLWPGRLCLSWKISQFYGTSKTWASFSITNRDRLNGTLRNGDFFFSIVHDRIAVFAIRAVFVSGPSIFKYIILTHWDPGKIATILETIC